MIIPQGVRGMVIPPCGGEFLPFAITASPLHHYSNLLTTLPSLLPLQLSPLYNLYTANALSILHCCPLIDLSEHNLTAHFAPHVPSLVHDYPSLYFHVGNLVAIHSIPSLLLYSHVSIHTPLAVFHMDFFLMSSMPSFKINYPNLFSPSFPHSFLLLFISFFYIGVFPFLYYYTSF